MAIKHRYPGVGARHRNSQGQMAPLSKRLSAHQAAMREERMQWRSNLARHIGVINGTLASFFRRGFFGRLKWLVVGK